MANDRPWTKARLGDLVQVKHGWPFKSELFSEELTGLPIVVNIGNFRYTGGFRFESTTAKEYRGEYPKEYELSPRDILLVMTCQTAGGEILGIPARVPDDGKTYLHNQRLGRLVVTASSRVDQNYLYWLFLWPEFNRELFVTATGTKILHTAPGRIENFHFHLPSLDEQHRIADILGTVDDKIELNRHMNGTLEAMARALFKSWFIDFDPVRAKADGRRPAGLDAATAALFPDRFEDSPLGKIPKGWRVVTLAEVAENPRRGIAAEMIDATTPYIGLEHMPRRCIALSDWGGADELESNKSKFKRGEILFGKLRPYFHKVGVAAVDGVCSTDILVIRPKSPDWLGFLLGHISSEEFVAYTDSASTGTKMPRTNWNDMSRYSIVLPPERAASRLTDLIEPMLWEIDANIHESCTLAGLRDTLLPKLLSGQLRV